MVVTDARKFVDRLMSEADLQDQVVSLARRTGWLVFHDQDSKRNEPGLPDLFMVHPARAIVLIVELKREEGQVSTKRRWNKKKTRLLPSQKDWLEALKAVEYRIAERFPDSPFKVRVWRPRDWDEIREVLSGGCAFD